MFSYEVNFSEQPFDITHAGSYVCSYLILERTPQVKPSQSQKNQAL